MLLQQLQTDMISSLKKGDRVRVDTLRFLISAVKNYAIAKYGSTGETSLRDEDVLDVIKKQVKTHKESILAFEGAGRMELAEKEKEELNILSTFLPQELSDEELRVLLTPVVSEIRTNTPSGVEPNFGLLMKAAMAKVHGQADGKRVSGMLKQMLQK